LAIPPANQQIEEVPDANNLTLANDQTLNIDNTFTAMNSSRVNDDEIMSSGKNKLDGSIKLKKKRNVPRNEIPMSFSKPPPS